MFIVTKVLWLLFNPSSLFLAALVFLAVQAFRKRWRSVRRWGIGLAGVSVLLCLFPVGDWLLFPLETRFTRSAADKNIAGVIVLGGAIDPVLSRQWQSVQLNGNAERLLAGLAILRKNVEIKLYFTGGSGNPLMQKDKEADWAERLLRSLGAPMDRIVFERAARNSWENALNLKKLIGREAGAPYLLVTSAAHMPRAVGVFRQAGWNVRAYPVDYTVAPHFRWIRAQSLHAALGRLSAALYEWGGLVTYRVSGRSGSILPSPEDG